MIAKITRGNRVGDIGAYLHGPGKANEHEYTLAGRQHSGGIVIGSNVGAEGETEPKYWSTEIRAAQNQRPEITKAIWQCSLRNTATDRLLSDEEWAAAGQQFIDDMGLTEHPWVMVRHGADHVHIVASRVNDEGEVWHGRHDRRNAQRACTKLEKAYGLQQAPRRKRGPKQTVAEERTRYRQKVHQISAKRAGIPPKPSHAPTVGAPPTPQTSTEREWGEQSAKLRAMMTQNRPHGLNPKTESVQRSFADRQREVQRQQKRGRGR